MSDKEKLIENIKKWVKIDNEIKELKKLQNERKEIQKELSTNLMTSMKENNIDMFNMKQGSIHYKQSKIKKPITKKMLQDVLLKYYNNDLAKATRFFCPEDNSPVFLFKKFCKFKSSIISFILCLISFTPYNLAYTSKFCLTVNFFGNSI